MKNEGNARKATYHKTKRNQTKLKQLYVGSISKKQAYEKKHGYLEDGAKNQSHIYHRTIIAHGLLRLC